MKKRIAFVFLALLTAMILLFAVCSCNQKADTTTAENTTNESTAVTTKKEDTSVTTTKETDQTTKKPETTKYPTLEELPELSPLALKWDEGQIFPTFPKMSRNIGSFHPHSITIL